MKIFLKSKKSLEHCVTWATLYIYRLKALMKNEGGDSGR